MQPALKTYMSVQEPSTAVFLVPGYSGGLSAPLIAFVADVFSKTPHTDVYGFDFQYDSKEEGGAFEEKVSLMREHIRAYRVKHPLSNAFIVGKSLGGALALAAAEPDLVSGVVVLGWPVRLGWPSRISLLGSQDLAEPPYKEEWDKLLSGLSVPIMFINGDADDLMDFQFLEECIAEHSNIVARSIPHGDHGLMVDRSTDNYPLVSIMLKRFVTDPSEH